jgi:YidC/Oxa1 family membrane protein insertase
MNNDEPDHKRVFISLLLASLVLFFWQYKVEWPRRQQLAKMEQQETGKRKEVESKQAAAAVAREGNSPEEAKLTWEQRIALSPRVAIESDMLHGSIALKGARFDDLTLKQYKESQEPDSPNVTLFAPNGGVDAYFAQIGFLAAGKIAVPDEHSLWQADKKTLTPGNSVTLRWDNGAGVIFVEDVSLDERYMFTISQHIENHSGSEIKIMPYAYINRAYEDPKQPNVVIHQGPLGVMDGMLNEALYKDLRDKGNKVYENASGWFGITDKYWLSALIPSGGHNKVTFSYYASAGKDRYQTDYLGEAIAIAPGATGENQTRLFAGAKVLNILDAYAKGDAAHNVPPISLFDRSIDFGALYFLTKPMLMTLVFFHALFGNFGIAIMSLTIVVRVLLYPLANKSFHATAKMRELQPEIAKLRERYFDDQITLQKETMALYKRQKVNPAAGCLPVIIQMPVFFSLYKVLYVAIEMRQASFFGWLKDLSSADPSNIFTGFGLIPWEPFSWMHLGVLPILMCATMVIQMKQQPKPADPAQARMMMYMPYLMLLLFAKMPAGLVLYWTWSNLISILQQRVITKHHAFNKARKAKKAAA